LSLDQSVHRALASLPADDERPLATLLATHVELVQLFRRAVLYRAAVYKLGQRKSEVNGYLKLEFDGVMPTQAPFIDAEKNTELDGFPTAEVMTIADSLSLSDEHWRALAKEVPTSPVQWFATLISWRTSDHLKRQDLTLHTPERPPTADGHYALAYRMWVLQTLDIAENHSTPTKDVKGVYQQTLTRVYQQVDDAAAAQPADGPAYFLKKVFPRHGWREQASQPLGPNEDWLSQRITSVEARSGAWSSAVEHATRERQTVCSLPDLLDRSSAHHRQQSTGPAWPEVLTWTGDADVVDAGGDTLKKRLGQRAKRITRLDKKLLSLVGDVVDDIRRQYGVKEVVCS
jgi:hypothetical protein